MNQRDFIYWEMASQDTIDFKKVYVDMADDLIAGLLLSQIVYWHLPSKETGKTRLRVEKEGHLWIAKERAEWYDEIRISIKQYSRAIKILESKGLVIIKKYRFNSQPIPHIRLNWDNFLASLHNQTEINGTKNGFEPYSPMGKDERAFPEVTKGHFPKGPKGISRKDERDVPLTESTNKDYLTKITNKDYISLSQEEAELYEMILSQYGYSEREINKMILYFDLKNLNPTKNELILQCKHMQAKGNEIRHRVIYFINGIEANIGRQYENDDNQNDSRQDTKVPFYNWLDE
jgi:hypothetical protein